MSDADLKVLQQKPIAEINPALGELSRDQLTELLALEADSNSPRETLTKAIAARIEKLDADDGQAPIESAEPRQIAHQHPDYSGPLTIEQAEWRNRNLKPAKVQKTK